VLELQASPTERQFVAGPNPVDEREMSWHVVEQTFVQHSTLPWQPAPIGEQSWPVEHTPAPPSPALQ
jgi:hypothetical protein